MNTTEHLAIIKSYCLRNLEIASKRTPGVWAWNESAGLADNSHQQINQLLDAGNKTKRRNNGRFIAACAGAAEAGWKATIAAVDWILSSHELADAGVYLQDCVNGDIERLTNEILAAYPLTLIQP